VETSLVQFVHTGHPSNVDLKAVRGALGIYSNRFEQVAAGLLGSTDAYGFAFQWTQVAPTRKRRIDTGVAQPFGKRVVSTPKRHGAGMLLQSSAFTSRALPGALLAILLAACGPSEQEIFDEAISEGLAAIAIDDLDLAGDRIEAAASLRPTDPALLAASQALETLLQSRSAFLEAELLLESGEFLASRELFLLVPADDTARYESAKANVLAAEERWLDATAEALDRLLAAEDLVGLIEAVGQARRALPSPALEELLAGDRAEQVLLTLSVVAAERVAAEDFNGAERIIDRVTAAFPLSDSESSDEVRRVSDFAAAERTRVTRVRSEEAARRQQEAQEEMQPSRPSPQSPSGDCPSPVSDPDGFRQCLDARLAEVPSAPDTPNADVSGPPSAAPSTDSDEPGLFESCPTFDSGIQASIGTVTGTISEPNVFGTSSLSLEFSGSITNSSSGWMRIFQATYVLYYGDERENHPGHATQLTTTDGSSDGGWLSPGSIQRLVRGGAPPHSVQDRIPTHIEFMAGASLRAEEQPSFCNPNGEWSFDSVRVAITY